MPICVNVEKLLKTSSDGDGHPVSVQTVGLVPDLCQKGDVMDELGAFYIVLPFTLRSTELAASVCLRIVTCDDDRTLTCSSAHSTPQS